MPTLITAKFIDRHSLVLSTATLNGNRARISGIRNDVATVTDARSGQSVQFSWETVVRVVNSGGNFKS